MTWYSIKISPEDKLFSEFIRKRDGKCAYCKEQYAFSRLQCSHYHGRRKESVRFDAENCDAFCSGCHKKLEHEKGWTDGIVNGERVSLPKLYTQWKINQLGQKRFDALTLRANKPQRKDRKMELIRVKQLLKTLKAA